ncbi:MAG: hypothetical protein LBD66_02210, partial [Holosporales bacterium]|nr:hypothetical protein [Holosporales bacterium]
WPDEDHYASAEDLALFARRLITDFPEHYHYFSEKEFLISGILQRNRNALLWRNLGVDGLKTGRTDAGGYGIVVSAQQKGHRLIAVVNGCVSNKERVRDIEALLRWGFNGFSFYKIVRSREPLSSAEVWLGEKATVDLETDQDICFIVPRLQAQNVEIEVVYQGPLKAPIEKGARVASLWISVPGKEPVEYPLFACTSIKQVGPLKRIPTAITSLLFGVQSP